MKKILIAVPIILVLLVAGLFIAPSLVPSSVYKDTIETQLSEKLDRDVRISGDIQLQAFPVIKAQTGPVEVSNPDGFTADSFASMSGLSARIKLFPLLSKRVEIASFTLKDPNISLEKLADGRANWVIGDAPQTPKPETEQGPFKRDGRFSDIDSAIGKFTLENGTVSYTDHMSGASHTISGMNLDFSLASLSAPLELDGRLVYNDIPATLSLNLDSIRGFLDGQSAPIDLSLETDFTQINAQGEFLPGEDIAARITLDGQVSDLAKLMSLAPVDIDIGTAVSTINLAGQYTFEDGILSAQGADISANGAALNAEFKGDALLKQPPSFNGLVNVQSADIQSLLAALPQDLLKDAIPDDLKGLDLLRSVSLSSSLATKGEGFAASGIDANLVGDGFNASYQGAADIAEAISANGNFSASAASLPTLIDAFGIDVPQARAVNAVSASGNLSYAGELISVTNLVASLKDGAVNGDYTGGFTLNGTTPAAQGSFNINVPSAANALEIAAIDVPQAAVLGAVNASGNITLAGETVDVKAISVNLINGQVNGSYNGDVSLNDGVSLGGTLNLDVPSMRAAAQTTGTELPPSTAAGPTFGPLSVTGQVSGTADKLAFSNANINFDALSGQGNFDVDLARNVPLANATLDMAAIDLRPYMPPKTAQASTNQGVPPWSTDPIDVSFLKTVDFNFKVTTPSIVTQSVTLGQSQANATLRSGVLTADIPNVSLYGGLGRINAVVDGSRSTPRVSLEAGLADLNSNELLTSVASFTKLMGDGGTTLKLSGSGNSQAEIMSSLSGGGDFAVKNGQIAGIDLSQFLSGLEQSLQTRALPAGIGDSYATKFNDIVGLFTIQNGVVGVDDFSLSGLGVLADGSGQIDLGRQNIDFRLRPRLTSESAGSLGSSGIPLKFTGSFGNAKAGLDTDFLGEIVKERARQEAQNLIREQIGDNLGGVAGGVLGGVLGGQGSTDTQSSGGGIGGVLGGVLGGQGSTDTQPSGGAAGSVLGGLFGQTPQQQPQQPQQQQPQNPQTQPEKKEEPKVEDAVEDAIGSIFGFGR